MKGLTTGDLVGEDVTGDAVGELVVGVWEGAPVGELEGEAGEAVGEDDTGRRLGGEVCAFVGV